MSGLLQRLAARATGSAWTVHSDARLPFAEPPTMEAPAEPSPAPRTVTARAQPPSAPWTAEAGTDASPMHATTIGRAAAVEPAETAADPPAWPAPFMPASSTHTPSNDAAPAARLQQAPAPSTDTRTTPVRSAAEPRTVPLVAADPPVLMPGHSKAAPPPRAPIHAASIPRMPASAPTAPATEVHVHIGRIEVTALPAPAPRPRPARERTQPMSLDTYLAKKRST